MRFAGVRLWLIVTWASSLSGGAAASGATIGYHDPSLEALGARLESELDSEGYDADVELLDREPTCDGEADATPAPAGEVVVRLGRPTGSADTACASIAYGTTTGARRTQVTAPLNDVARFSIQVAEALNGLRTRTPDAPPGSATTTTSRPQLDLHTESAPEREAIALGAVMNLWLDARHTNPLFGVGLLAELPLSPRWHLHLEGGGTLSALTVVQETTELSSRATWARVGGALEVVSAPVRVDVIANTGLALTWATGRVPAPDMARADIATSAMFSLGAAGSYPSGGPVQLVAALRATTLVPSLRFELPRGPSAPFGQLLLEAALGAKAAW